MSAIALSCIAFVCISGGVLLIGTIGALVLGPLIASAKSSYDTQKMASPTTIPKNQLGPVIGPLGSSGGMSTD